MKILKILILIILFLYSEDTFAATVTKTIGTAIGRDYSTITAWEADLDNAGIYSAGDDAVGDLYNDSTFDESVTIDNSGYPALNSITIEAASGQRHTGTAGTGVRLVGSAARTWTVTATSTGGIFIKWIEFDFGDFDSQITGNYNNNTVTTYLQNNLIHDAIGPAGSDSLINGNNVKMVITNNIIYNAAGASGTGNWRAILLSNSARNYNVDNNTVWNTTKNGGTGSATGISFQDDTQHVIQNNIVMDTGGAASGTKVDYSPSSCVSATCDHNLSSDTTASGTGSLTSKSSANQFVSTVEGSEDLHLKTGADAIDAGTDLITTPTDINLDIDGYDRDAIGVVWDMGADEFVAAASTGRVIRLQGIRLYGIRLQ